MHYTLVVLAAWMGSRYQAEWGRLKQIDYFGPHNEILLEYSIYDAIQAGFDKVIFVIRKDFEEEFKNLIKNLPTDKIQVQFAFQEGDDLPDGFIKPETRIKPRGTGHAMRAALSLIQDENFAVINADDFYGRESYLILANFLKHAQNEGCVVGYHISQVLSQNGPVSRGICEIEGDHLIQLTETKKIMRQENGEILSLESGVKVDNDAICSMNMLGFPNEIIPYFERYFTDFLKENLDSETQEFYVQNVLMQWSKETGQKLKLLKTPSQRFGVTYQQDKEETRKKIKSLIERGVYPENLWEW